MALTFNIVGNVPVDRLLVGIFHIDNLEKKYGELTTETLMLKKQKVIRISTSIETLCSFDILNKYRIKLIAVDAPLVEHCSFYK